MTFQSCNSTQSLGLEAQAIIKDLLQRPEATQATQQDIYEVPLSDHTVSTLAVAIVSFVDTDSPNEVSKMISVINLAADLHAPDIRHRKPPQAYIIHPLRNTLRLIRLGASNISLLMASVLHDTVEDHPFELAQKAGLTTTTTTTDEQQARDHALAYLSERYGAQTARIVEGMSNPVMAVNVTRDEVVRMYLDHVRSATVDPMVFACKASDLIDNAVGLNDEQMEPAKLLRMAKKYVPAIEIMLDRLEQGEQDGDLPLSADGIKAVRSQLRLGHDRLGSALQGKE